MMLPLVVLLFCGAISCSVFRSDEGRVENNITSIKDIYATIRSLDPQFEEAVDSVAATFRCNSAKLSDCWIYQVDSETLQNLFLERVNSLKSKMDPSLFKAVLETLETRAINQAHCKKIIEDQSFMISLNSGTLYLKDLNNSNAEYIKTYFADALKLCEFERVYIDIASEFSFYDEFFGDHLNQVSSLSLFFDRRQPFSVIAQIVSKINKLTELELNGVHFVNEKPGMCDFINRIRKLKLNSCSFGNTPVFYTAIKNSSSLNSIYLELTNIDVPKLVESVMKNMNIKQLEFRFCEFEYELLSLLRREPSVELNLIGNEKFAFLEIFEEKLKVFKERLEKRKVRLQERQAEAFQFTFENELHNPLVWLKPRFYAFRPDFLKELVDKVKDFDLEIEFKFIFKITSWTFEEIKTNLDSAKDVIPSINRKRISFDFSYIKFSDQQISELKETGFNIQCLPFREIEKSEYDSALIRIVKEFKPDERFTPVFDDLLSKGGDIYAYNSKALKMLLRRIDDTADAALKEDITAFLNSRNLIKGCFPRHFEQVVGDDFMPQAKTPYGRKYYIHLMWISLDYYTKPQILFPYPKETILKNHLAKLFWWARKNPNQGFSILFSNKIEHPK